MPRQRSRSPLSPILATESATVRLFFILSVLLCSVNKAGLKTETWLLYCLRLRSRSPHNAKHSTSLFIYIVRPTVLAPGWPRATRKRSRPDRGGVRLQLLLCYIYTCSTDMPDVQRSYESRHSYEFTRNESSKGTLEGASPS